MKCYKKSPDFIILQNPPRANGISDQNFDWVNYTINLDAMPSFLPYDTVKNKLWLKDCQQTLVLALSKFIRIN